MWVTFPVGWPVLPLPQPPDEWWLKLWEHWHLSTIPAAAPPSSTGVQKKLAWTRHSGLMELHLVHKLYVALSLSYSHVMEALCDWWQCDSFAVSWVSDLTPRCSLCPRWSYPCNWRGSRACLGRLEDPRFWAQDPGKVKNFTHVTGAGLFLNSQCMGSWNSLRSLSLFYGSRL